MSQMEVLELLSDQKPLTRMEIVDKLVGQNANRINKNTVLKAICCLKKKKALEVISRTQFSVTYQITQTGFEELRRRNVIKN